MEGPLLARRHTALVARVIYGLWFMHNPNEITMYNHH